MFWMRRRALSLNKGQLHFLLYHQHVVRQQNVSLEQRAFGKMVVILENKLLVMPGNNK